MQTINTSYLDLAETRPGQKGFTRLLLIGILASLSYWGNFLDIQISFGVHFIFGSIAALIAAVWFNSLAALCVAFVGSISTFFLWHHANYIPIAVAEALFVSFTYRRFWGNIIVATTIFWLVPGALLFLLFYGGVMHIEPRGLLFLWSKQCVNGIFNSMIASGLLILASLIRYQKLRIPLQEAFFNTFVAVVFIPILSLVAMSSRERMHAIETAIGSNTSDQARNIVHYLTLWRQQNLNAVESLAKVAKQRGIKPSANIQRDMQIIHATHPNFYDIFVADKTGTTVGFHPPVGPKGEKLIGLNFSDRKYFRDIMRQKTPLISDVLLGRGGIDFPIFCFVSPILDDANTFQGFALGSYDVRLLAEAIKLLVSDSSFKVTITDAQGTIITSTSPDITPLSSISQSFFTDIVRSSESSYQRIPEKINDLPYRIWQNTAFGSIYKIPSIGWSVYVETSLGPYTQQIESFYIQSFIEMLALTVAGIGLSLFMIRWVSTPITRLAAWTTDISKELLIAKKEAWPRSHFAEISVLVENFSTMSDKLKQRFVELTKEITERKSAEVKLHIAMREAQAANVAKSEFLANMSHEIRTPLAAIIGYAELMKANDSHAQDKGLSLDAIMRNGMQLSQLVNDILDLSKIEAGHLQIQSVWVTLDDIVASGVESLRCRADQKGIQLKINGHGTFPDRVYVDPTRLNQILLNLVGNAIKFTEEGQVEVIFSLLRDPHQPHGGFLVVRIEDTGIGIAEEIQPNLFKPFAQGDATYARRYGGTGLGLALSRKLASALGGGVQLIKSNAHIGSTFEVKIRVGLMADQPWYPDLSSARKANQSPPRGPSDNKDLLGKNILLVEDSPDNRLLVSRMLERYGAHVACAASGDEGIIMAQNAAWDAVLMDMQMPITDGYKATATLRARGYKRPIIALTAHALAEEREKCLASGCDEHVTKPVPWAHLVTVINTLCDASPINFHSTPQCAPTIENHDF